MTAMSEAPVPVKMGVEDVLLVVLITEAAMLLSVAR
jgi:hypothetical protein